MQTPHHKTSTKALALLILLHHLSIQVSSVDTLKQGERLDSSSELVSANGIFTLRFYTPRATNNTYLAIWFGDLPTWIGNREKPVHSNSSPALTVGIRGELTITHDDGDDVRLYAGGSGQNITARLLNTGNLVVTSDESSGILWQSFDHPTDTLLPGMKIGRSGKSSLTLSSWKVDDFNPAPGAFTLEWDPSTQNLLVRRKGGVYWRSGELKNYTQRVGNKRGGFDVNFWNHNFTRITSDEEEEDYLNFSSIPQGVMAGWRLDGDGNIEDINQRPLTIAKPGLCYNYYKDKSAVTPGCEPREQPQCRNEHDGFGLRSGSYRPNTYTVDFDQNSNLSLDDCLEACWKDCDCSAYRGGEGGGCQYLKGKNLDFVQSLAGAAVPIYILEREAPSSKGMKKHVRIILIVLGSVVLLIFGITFSLCENINWEEELRELLTLEGYTEASELENGGGKSHDLKLFTYASIVSATTNFSSGKKLGEGGFGPVYKGKTGEGQDIAVKLLSRLSGQGLLEFKTELILISKLQHVNLVKLLGFCIHGDDKMIIYEYMQNKSLDCFLFSPSKREQLDWQKRFNIIEGTAQGLLYLHKYSRLRIIHRDLKPNNILLDDNMNPKISDFGLARIFKQNADEANTNRRVGTYGYMAPEYAMQGIFSVKSDVYSFGVLVLEIVSGQKNNSFHQIEGPLNLVEYALELWRKDSAIELMDPTLKDTCIIDQLQRCIHIGLLCVENHAVDRPTIEDVISMLKNETTSLPMPKSPAFITRNCLAEELAKSKPEKLSSTNEVTLSEMEGR